jgi:outer membrane lipoprotein carrier protein
VSDGIEARGDRVVRGRRLIGCVVEGRVKRQHSWSTRAWLVVGLLFARTGLAEGDPLAECARDAVSRIQSRYEGVSDLSARFEQTARGGALGPGKVSRGSVAFSKPGRMRWSYEEPEKSLVVSNGKTLWLYDEARREVQKMSVSGGYFSGASIQFLVGRGDVLEEFDVIALACDAKTAHLQLTPRTPQSFERLRVEANRKNGDIEETTVVDLLGNETRVAFLEIRVDRKLRASEFEFEPPAGVQVIELAAPDAPGPR